MALHFFFESSVLSRWILSRCDSPVGLVRIHIPTYRIDGSLTRVLYVKMEYLVAGSGWAFFAPNNIDQIILQRHQLRITLFQLLVQGLGIGWSRIGRYDQDGYRRKH